MSALRYRQFWASQIQGLGLWGLAWIQCHVLGHRKAHFYSNPKSASTKAMVIILPGIGGQYTQFYWLIRAIVLQCAVDLLYFHPKWGSSLEEDANALNVLLEEHYSGYENIIAIGHSRGGLLGKAFLDRTKIGKRHLLITMASPWKSLLSDRDAGLRGWIARGRAKQWVSLLFRWPESKFKDLTENHNEPDYPTISIASLFDPIVGDPIYQCPAEQPTICQKTSHLSMPLDFQTIDFIVKEILKNK